ncbi:DUF2637 domain-containing protein [Couchioplanes caeruleus]|uniref:DUF2637 domain-containing protein n=1 Tax=Couchioplanes caeruleus TaxID=56438 RepID=UPI0020BD9631|nr:DUF2637 domain-containing protein [Couchioplanes caeruleus]UQU66400.1 DUF2637 domain-containing protein [Couchioplanes caeruleus]
MILPQLRRVRWAVRATLVLGVAASVVANILHALDNPISQAIAAWPPLALLLTVELISRVPVHRRSLAAARLVATATIAGIAAWVSYWHMAGVAARYGETGASPYLLPLSVDGLIVVASICLVELGGRISAVEHETREATPAAQPVVPGLIPVPAPAPTSSNPTASPATTAPAAATATTAASQAATAKGTAATGATALRRTTAAALAEVAATLPATLPKTRAPETSSFKPVLTRAQATTARTGPASPAKPKARRSPAETVAAAAKIKASRPDLTDAQLAAELGISVSRWRTIRRETGADDNLRLAA